MMTKPELALPNLGNTHPVYTGSNSLSPFHAVSYTHLTLPTNREV